MAVEGIPTTSDVPDRGGGSDDLGEATGGLVPGWLETLAALSWRMVAFVLLVVVLVAIAVLLTNVTAAILVAFLVVAFVEPLAGRLRARGWGPSKVAATTSVVALVGTLAVAVLILVGVLPAASDIVRYANEGSGHLVARLQDLGFPPTVIGLVTDFTDGFVTWVNGIAQGVGAKLGDIGTVLVLGGFLTFYVLEDGGRFITNLTRGLAGSHAEDVDTRWSEALWRVGRFMRGTLVTASIDAVTDFIFLTLLGVPLAGPLAVVVFVGGFIPYLGAFFTVSVLLLVTWSTAGAGAAGLLLVLIVGVNLLHTLVINSRAHARAPGVSPALVIVAVPAGGALFGIIGLVAAVPVTVIVIALLPAVIGVLDDDPSTDRAPSLVPVWLDRIGQWSWRALAVIAAVALVIGGMLLVPMITVPAILAGVFAATLRPVVNKLRAAGVGPAASAAITTAGSAVVIILVLAVTFLSIAGSAGDMVAHAKQGADKAGLGGALTDMVDKTASGMNFNINTFIANLAGVTLAVLIVMFIMYFLMSDGPRWWKAILAKAPADRRPTLSSIVGDGSDILSGYMVGTSLIALFAAVTQWGMMVLLGLPLAVPVGVLTFFLSFIPYVGDMLATGLGLLVAIAAGSTTDVVLMVAFTLVINIVQGNIVAPLVYKRTVSLPPAIVLLATPAGAAVGGILGMFLVVPFLGVIAATWRNVLRLFDPNPPPPADDPAIDADSGRVGAPDTAPDAPAAAPGA